MKTNPHYILCALALGTIAAMPSAADTIYQIRFAGVFNAGLLRDTASNGGTGDLIPLDGLPVSETLTYDLSKAPADVFTGGAPNTNSIGSAAAPLFVSSVVDLSSVVAQLQALGNPNDLPVPTMLNVTPLPGGGLSNIGQTLNFTQFPGGTASVLGTFGASSQILSSTQSQILSWAVGGLVGSLNPFLPLGNYAAEGYPSFTFNGSTPGITANAFLGVTDSNLLFTTPTPIFTADFTITGGIGAGNAIITVSSVSGGLVTPEPGTALIVAPAMLVLLLLRRRGSADDGGVRI